MRRFIAKTIAPFAPKICAALFAAALFAACSNMMEELKTVEFARPAVPPKKLDIKDAEMKNPGGIVTVTVADEVPTTAKPKITYELPNGTKVEVEGTVAVNDDGTRTLTFDLKPIPQELEGGTLPMTLDVPGNYLPTPVEGINYIPQAEVQMEFEGKSGDEFTIFNSEASEFPPPVVTTNYHDNIDTNIEYLDPNGDSIGDLDGDGKVDWEDAKLWMGDEANGGTALTVKATATPNPDTDPSAAGSKEVKINCKKDPPITSAAAEPAKPEVGQTATAKVYCGTEEYTGKTVAWQWYKADSSAGAGTAIDGATKAQYLVDDSLYGKYIYAVATQTLASQTVVKTTNRLEVNPSASVNPTINVETRTFTMAHEDLGQNKFKFDVTTNLESPTIKWLVDGTQKATGATFTLDLSQNAYQHGWHSVEAYCFKDGTPYSARASVKKKIAQSAPASASGGVTKESAWKAADGKIQIAAPYERAQYSLDGGTTWTNVADTGLISGLGLGDDWTAELQVVLRYNADDDYAMSAETTISLGIEKYTVTHTATNGSISITPAGTPTDKMPAGVTVSLTATAAEYYTLDASSIAAATASASVALTGSGATRTFTMPGADVTLTAAFNKTVYNISVDSAIEHGTVTPSAASSAWGETVTLTVSPAAGYRLKDNSLKFNGSAATKTDETTYTFTMPKCDAAVTAEFEKISYALALPSTAEGSVSAAPASPVAWGETVTLTVEPAAYYKLKADSLKANDGAVTLTPVTAGTEYSFTMPQGAVTVTAEFERITYTVTFDANGGTGTMDPQTFQAGIAQALTANAFTAPDGKTFDGWATAADGAKAYDDSASYTATGDITLYAVWKEIPQQPEPGQPGADNYTYNTSDFLSTKFYTVRDVQWATDDPSHNVRELGLPYDLSGEGPEQLTSWPDGTYVMLSKNSSTTTAGYYFGNENTSKSIPTYTMTLYTPGQSPEVIGTSVVILGLDKEKGFMTENSSFGTFFYTQKGWAESNQGSSNIAVNYTGCIYPTYDEIVNYINQQ